MSATEPISSEETAPAPPPAPAESFIVFEQPLHERMRTLMRLEYLFNKFAHFSHGESEWDSRAALDTLLEILNLLNRSDIKSELIREVERQITTLERIPDKPGIDGSLCAQLVRQLREYSERLAQINGMAGNELKRNEFLKSISQRASMPGGTGPIDLPNLHYWLHRDAAARIDLLDSLYSSVAPIKHALYLVLNLIRESSPATAEVAVGGNYTRTLEPDVAYQLVRVVLRVEERCIAEISSGKFRTSIRFLEPATDERPKPVERSVPFHLVCCRL